jgi:hypothetical protein
MELGPFDVYKKALAAVPSLKYALGVAGIVAAAMIAYNLSNNDPRKAVLGFIFVLAGMYLLLIFASIGKVGDIVRGPVIAIVWAVTIFFIACLVLTLTAYTFGWPAEVAKLVGATPAALRVATATGTPTTPAEPSSSTSTQPSIASAPAAIATSALPAPVPVPPPPQPVPIAESFKISDSSDDCGVDRRQTLEYCLASPATLVNWSGPQIESANCGSSISNVRAVPSKPNCVAVDVHLRGCGYDDFVFAKNCRGRGWIGGSLVLNGQRPGN